MPRLIGFIAIHTFVYSKDSGQPVIGAVWSESLLSEWGSIRVIWYPLSAYVPVIRNRCTPPSPYGDGRQIVGLMCGAVTFWIPLQCWVSAGLVILRKYTPMEFTVIKSRIMTRSRSPQCRAFSRGAMDEKSPLFPVGVGGWAMVTNDWCISEDESMTAGWSKSSPGTHDIQ